VRVSDAKSTLVALVSDAARAGEVTGWRVLAKCSLQ
jgi:hypothetical protein